MEWTEHLIRSNARAGVKRAACRKLREAGGARPLYSARVLRAALSPLDCAQAVLVAVLVAVRLRHGRSCPMQHGVRFALPLEDGERAEKDGKGDGTGSARDSERKQRKTGARMRRRVRRR